MESPPRYRWVILLTCFTMFFIVMGLGNSTSSLYIVPVTRHYGFSRGDFSLVYSLITIATALMQFVYGPLLRRVGVRALVIAGSLLAPAAYFIFAAATSLPAFYAAGILLGLSLGLVSIISAAILVNNWFDRRQGLLLGVIISSTGLGGSLFSLLIGSVIAGRGFQAAYFLSAVILTTATLPVIFLIRSQPPAVARAEGSAPAPVAEKMPVRIFLKNPAALSGLLTVFLLGFCIYPYFVNTAPYLVEMGYSPVFTAGMLSVLLLSLGAAKIGLGYIHDRLGVRACLFLGLGAFVLGLVMLLLSNSEGMVVVYVICIGIAIAMLTVFMPLYVTAVLGRENTHFYLGIYMAVMNAGSTLGGPVMNYAFDLFGTYNGITAVLAGMGVVTLLLGNLALQRNSAAAVKSPA